MKTELDAEQRERTNFVDNGREKREMSTSRMLSKLECLPNELFYSIFLYLHPIDLIFAFYNLNSRWNRFLLSYLTIQAKHLDLTRLNPRVFQFYRENNPFKELFSSIRLTGEQFHSISPHLSTELRHFDLQLSHREYSLTDQQLNLFTSLHTLIIRGEPVVWSSSGFIRCPCLRDLQIHLKSHRDLLQVLSSLPLLRRFHVTIEQQVSR